VTSQCYDDHSSPQLVVCALISPFPMAPNEFFVRLQKGIGCLQLHLKRLSSSFTGITGGFAPPKPSEIHVLTLSTDRPNILAVDSQYRADGSSSLQSTNTEPKTVSLSENEANNKELIDELHDILKYLPTEKPPGSQDIYGMDTSIAWGSQDLEWHNGGPAGCSKGTSEVQATDEEKAKFKRAVEIIRSLATK
jgi:hypothetical protein